MNTSGVVSEVVVVVIVVVWVEEPGAHSYAPILNDPLGEQEGMLVFILGNIVMTLFPEFKAGLPDDKAKLPFAGSTNRGFILIEFVTVVPPPLGKPIAPVSS
jgi:hypothetical protein